MHSINAIHSTIYHVHKQQTKRTANTHIDIKNQHCNIAIATVEIKYINTYHTVYTPLYAAILYMINMCCV